MENKLPLIIREELGEDIYNQMNKAVSENRETDKGIKIRLRARGLPIIS
jgi:hypothetical protein